MHSNEQQQILFDVHRVDKHYYSLQWKKNLSILLAKCIIHSFRQPDNYLSSIERTIPVRQELPTEKRHYKLYKSAPATPQNLHHASESTRFEIFIVY